MSTPDPLENPDPPPQRHASLLQVAGAVLWSFFGVRKGAAMTRDAATIRPWQVIVAGIGFAALFVLTLIAIVRLVIAHAT
jgi:hypothetical protein